MRFCGVGEDRTQLPSSEDPSSPQWDPVSCQLDRWGGGDSPFRESKYSMSVPSYLNEDSDRQSVMDEDSDRQSLINNDASSITSSATEQLQHKPANTVEEGAHNAAATHGTDWRNNYGTRTAGGPSSPPGSSSGSDSNMNSETPSRRPSLSAHYDPHPQTLPRWSLNPTSPYYKPWLVVGSLNCRTSRTNLIQANKDSSYRQLTILGLQEPYINPLIEPPQSYSKRHFKGSLAQLKGMGDLVTLRVMTVTNK